jgi:hypothetical protein
VVGWAAVVGATTAGEVGAAVVAAGELQAVAARARSNTILKIRTRFIFSSKNYEILGSGGSKTK